MSLDSVEQSVWNLTGLRKLLECFKLILELFVISVDRGDHLSHVTNCVGVETNTKDHPAATKCILDVVVTGNVTEADGCESLERPVKGDDVLLSWIIVLDSLSDDPWVVLKVRPFCLEEPEAADNMVDEKNGSDNLTHLSGSVTKFEHFGHALRRSICFHNSQKLEQSENSEQSIESWDSCKSKHFSVSCITWTEIQFLKNLKWKSCKQINEEPAFEIILGQSSLPHFKNTLSLFRSSEKG